MKKYLLISIGIIIIIAIIGVSLGIKNWFDTRTSNQNQNLAQPVSIKKGFAISPRSFDANDYNQFFDNAKANSGYITWSGSWEELPNGTPESLFKTIKQKGFEPVIIVQVFSQNTGKLIKPLDETNQQKVIDKITTFVKNNKPKYFGFGIEVNILYEKNPTDFNTYVNLFNKITVDVKKISDSTKVFPIFQLERMKGLNGGLFGGKNDSSKNQWSLLNKFPNADLFGFTTYPSLVFNSPNEIPGDYFEEISKHSDKDFVITEAGWHSDSSTPIFKGNETNQNDFTKRLPELLKDSKYEFFIWSFMYDPATQSPFDSMGFFDKTGKEKNGWNSWKEIELK